MAAGSGSSSSSSSMLPPKLRGTQSTKDFNLRPLTSSFIPKPDSSPVIKKHKPSTESSDFVVPTSNSFEALTNTTADDVIMSETESVASQLSRTRKQPNRHVDRPPLAKPKTKPIVIPRISFVTIRNSLVNVTLSAKPIFQKGYNEYKLFPANISDKKLIVAKLIELKIEHHTYAEPEDRHSLFVLKKFYPTDPANLLTKLQEANVPAVKVNVLFKNDSSASYLVHFEDSAIKFNDLIYNHSVIDYHKIGWKRFNKSDKPTQCHRCQLFGRLVTLPKTAAANIDASSVSTNTSRANVHERPA